MASSETCEAFRSLVDDMICLVQPSQIYAVGLWYVDFSQTSDAEVRALLDAAARDLEAKTQQHALPASPG